MGEQVGLFYWINPSNVATPNTSEGLRLYRSSIDNQYYVKKSDGTSELFSVGINGLMELIGTYDASTNLFPATGGSGPAGAIQKGDTWIISVAGVLGGVAVEAGDLIIALVDNPAQVAGNWNIVEKNLGYVPENVANKATDFTTVNNTLYPSVQAVENRISGTSGQVVFYAASGITGDAGFAWDNANQILSVGVTNGTIKVNGGSGFGSTLSVHQDTIAGYALDVYNENFSRFYIRAVQDGQGVGTNAVVEVMNIAGFDSAAKFADVNGTLRCVFGAGVVSDAATMSSRTNIQDNGTDALFGWTNSLSAVEINSPKGLGYAAPFLYMYTNEGAGVTGAYKLLSKGDSYFIGDSNQIGFGIQAPTARVHVKGFAGLYAVKVESDAGARLFDITNAGIISMPTLQTGNAGLVAGDLYVDSAANITGNGDVFVGRKA